MKKFSYNKILATLTAFLILSLPVFAYAQFPSLIVCDGVENPCTFNSVVQLVKNGIEFLVILSTFFATAVFAYAGIKLLTSGGNPSAKNEAKNAFTKVLIGYLIILSAWLVVYTIVNVLVDQGEYPSLLSN